MTRRIFLRVLGSAAIGAITVQVLPSLPLVDTPTTVSSWSLGAAGPLTFEMLEAAYQSCRSGKARPTLAVYPASIARRLGLVYEVELN